MKKLPHRRRRRYAVRKASSALCFVIVGASAGSARASEVAMHTQAGKAPLTIIAGTARAVQRGIASWYGRNFHGRPTASGERFDMHALSAAHPTLPLASYVRVRNLDNHKEVVVRINDRGPFHGGRIIDLSYAAAQQLDMVRGLGNVVLELITSGDVRPKRNERVITATAKRSESLASVPSAEPSPVPDAQNAPNAPATPLGSDTPASSVDAPSVVAAAPTSAH